MTQLRALLEQDPPDIRAIETHPDALDPGQPEHLFYQVVAACDSSGASEGPVF